jgi:hypothetical protein
VSDANVRRTRVRWCVLATVLFAVIAALVSVEWGPLMALDEAVGEWPEQVTRANEPMRDFWYAIAVGTGTIAKTIATAVVAVLLWVRNHRRAAIWTVAVMLSTGLATSAIKQVVGRERPVRE